MSELECQRQKLDRMIEARDPHTGVRILDGERYDSAVKKLDNIQMEKFIVSFYLSLKNI